MTEETETTVEIPAELPVKHQVGMLIAGTLAAFGVTKLVERGYKAGLKAWQAKKSVA